MEGSMDMTLDIPEGVVQALRLPRKGTKEELKKLLAVTLYEKGILGIGKARELAGASKTRVLCTSQEGGGSSELQRRGRGERHHNGKGSRSLKVVSDTSPIIAFSNLGKLHILKALFGRITIPHAWKGGREGAFRLSAAVKNILLREAKE